MVVTPDTIRLPEVALTPSVHALLDQLFVGRADVSTPTEQLTEREDYLQQTDGHRIPELARQNVRRIMTGSKPEPDRFRPHQVVVRNFEQTAQISSVEIIVFFEATAFTKYNPFYKEIAQSLTTWNPGGAENITIKLYPIHSTIAQVELSTEPAGEFASITQGEAAHPEVNFTAPELTQPVRTASYDSSRSFNLIKPFQEIMQAARQHHQVVMPLLLTTNKGTEREIITELVKGQILDRYQVGLCDGVTKACKLITEHDT